jgi:hypothetical protein
MTEAVQELLESFEMLSDAEKQEATAELLRRVVLEESGEISDEALTQVAEELFLELDREESADG